MSARNRIVIVGSGIAGLTAALLLSEKHDVTIVTKSELMESNTRYAQGGIAVAMFPDDSVAEHVADTMIAGAGLCNREAVGVLCSEGPARVRDLIALGVAFDQRNGELARGMEAAHSRARVLHARGDATGLSIEETLVAAVRAADIVLLENTFACDLQMAEEQVVGLEVLRTDNIRQVLAADAVILASGGAGQLYAHTTNPAGATGDGTALALRAGAQVADMEFYQFHPTALAVGDSFLISEAVRGEGAVLLDQNGRRFMATLHKDAELAPRDVVARGIALQMAAQGGKPVLLDATKLGAEFLRKRFPMIDAACRARGLEWAEQPVPVTPAAHYWMGGVRTDLWGQTSVPGLFAIGEAACTGVHGANRLASNSLLESLVFAWRCATKLLDSSPSAAAKQSIVLPASEAMMLEPSASSAGHAANMQRGELQRLMWNAAGIERNGDVLRAASDQLRRWAVAGDDMHSLETRNLLELARVLVAAALARQESRGAHFRADFPETEAAWQHSQVFATPAAVRC